ncbi:hypothetical protein RCL1_000111 [Eukaryota sp. TZLM3-RCL]
MPPPIRKAIRKRPKSAPGHHRIKPKPEWDSSINDLSVYRASPEELVRRKQERTSRNYLLGRDSPPPSHFASPSVQQFSPVPQRTPLDNLPCQKCARLEKKNLELELMVQELSSKIAELENSKKVTIIKTKPSKPLPQEVSVQTNIPHESQITDDKTSGDDETVVKNDETDDFSHEEVGKPTKQESKSDLIPNDLPGEEIKQSNLIESDFQSKSPIPPEATFQPRPSFEHFFSSFPEVKPTLSLSKNSLDLSQEIQETLDSSKRAASPPGLTLSTSGSLGSSFQGIEVPHLALHRSDLPAPTPKPAVPSLEFLESRSLLESAWVTNGPSFPVTITSPVEQEVVESKVKRRTSTARVIKTKKVPVVNCLGPRVGVH